MVVTHNLQSSNSSRVLGNTTGLIEKSTEKLSSGYQINRAADDAAGLAISEKMRKQIRGLNEGSVNSQNGISLVQIADGAMSEIHDMLQRANELSIHAANGTLSQADRQTCQDELDQIKEEIDGVRSRTFFNKIPVLKGLPVNIQGDMITPAHTKTITSGADLPEWLQNGIDNASLTNGYMASTYNTTVNVTYKLEGSDEELSGTATIPHSATYIDFSGVSADTISQLDGKGIYSTCCSCENRYSIKFDATSEANISTQSGQHHIYTIGIKGATSAADVLNRIMKGTKDSTGELGNPDNHYTKYAIEGSTLVIYDDRSSVSQATVWSSIDSTGTVTEVTFENFSASTGTGWENVNSYNTRANSRYGLFGLGYAETVPVDATYGTKPSSRSADINIHSGAEADMDNKIYILLPNVSCDAMNITTVDFMVPNGPEDAITRIGFAINYLSDERSRMGAYQNRLEHTIKNLDNVTENSQAAESRIRDTDMAKEMVSLSKNNILQQAGQAMLAQANHSTEGVMNLLQ